MANPGAGNRFVSVNLNKSYGPSSSHPNPNHHSNSFNYGSGRARSGGGGVGGGMVVLSRPRSSHKAGPKLSVPPPLNLPSLRKEHERFDSSGSAGGGSSGGIPGGGSRPSSSGLGWSKPGAIVSVERDGISGGDRPLSSDGAAPGIQAVDAVTRGGGSGYMPPSARSGASGPDVSMPMSMEKASVLRGEDFPSLRATLSAANGSAQKPKDSSHQRQRQGMSEEPSSGQEEGSRTDMRPQVQSQYSVGNSIRADGRDGHNSGNSRLLEHGQKQEDFFLGPLPLVRLSPRSDWADDERDTSHGLTDRGRDHNFSRTETYWDRDFDLPRSNFLPQKPVQNHFDRRGQRDNDVGKSSSNEVSNADPINRDVRGPSREGREGQSWKRPASREGFASQEGISDKNSLGPRPTSVNCETAKENKYIPFLPQLGGNTRDEHIGGNTVNRDVGTGRRDPGYVQGGRQQWTNSVHANNGMGAERNIRDRHGSESNRYKVDALQNSMGSRSSFSAGSRGPAGSDHSSNFGRDKRSFSRGEKPYTEDPFMSSDFDVRDPFSGGILGVVKRKKDAKQHLDFHDPVRESFEAELERVQKMQELERQRVIEEQERAMEIARREEEERQRLAREQEEHQRRLEEEAREAAWRAEQERLEAISRAEEQRLAREEEKQRILMEEERRRQAAKQKLQELEERIARRQAEAAKADGAADVQGEKRPAIAKERDVSRADDFAAWEDGERMVERITNTASSDSSVSRPFDMGSRALSVAEGSFAFADRGKSFNSWRRDVFENGSSSSFFSSEHENGYQSPRRDTFVGGRAFPRKDFYGGSGYIPSRGYYRGGTAEPQMEDFLHARGHRWSISGDGDPYGRNIELEAEFHESVRGKFEVDWSQGQGRGSSPFSERLYQNSELEDLYTYGRSRYPARQPRVLPPPSLPSVHRSSFRSDSEQARSSTYQDEDMSFNHAMGSESAAVSYQNAQEEHSDKLDNEQNAHDEEHDLNRSVTPGCDSQSSLCVSSAPSSPTQVSHDDLDDSRESLAVSGSAEDHGVCNSESEAVLPKAKDGRGTPSSISVGDDEEWTVENNGLQQQEEYDEDVRYNEEVQDGDDDNAELNQEFEAMHLEAKGSPHMKDNVVLGFDQGVEVGMPNDECERSPRIAENVYVGPQVIGGPTELNVSFDGSRGGQSPQVADVSQHLSTDASCLAVEDSEKAVQDYIPVPVNAPHTSKSSDLLSSGDSSSVSVLTAQQSIPPSVGAGLQSSSQSVMPSVAATQGTPELPVKLQFGLFSGPSLIPSPVPAIQIGSIQMPLQLPPQIGPSLSHMHAPQPPLFQFGQLRYPSPISQGFPHLAPQSMPFVQPTIPSHYPLGQRYGSPLSVQPVQESSTQSSVRDGALSLTMKSHHIQPPNPLKMRPDAELKEANLMAGEAEINDISHQNQADTSIAPMDQVRTESCKRTEIIGHVQNVVRNSKPLNKTSENRAQGGPPSSHFAANHGDTSGPTAQGPSGNKGRRLAFTARNPGGRSSSLSNETYRSDVNGFQRRRRGMQRFEFRVRQVTDGKQSSALASNYSGSDSKSNYDGDGSGMQQRSGPKKDVPYDQPKLTVDPHSSRSDQIITRETGSGIREDRPARKETSTGGLDTARCAEGSLKRNISSEDDVDAPLQSGIVRVFKQPGIETPSDEDDFIEVRSKRQMVNDRREQREKEIKAKSSNMRKGQRKSRSAPQGTSNARITGRISASLSTQATKNVHKVGMPKHGLGSNEVPAAFNKTVSQTLAPIGTPPINSDSQGGAKAQTAKPPPTSFCATTEQTVGSDLSFHAQSNALNGVHSSVGSQDNSQSNPQVMTLTQTQLEEAMKPVQFDKDVVSVGDRAGSVSETGMSSSSLAKDNSLPSATSPISCLLAGEKIQFGAVTSPTILPPSTRVVSQVMRAPASSQLDIKISRSMLPAENDCALLFEKEKHSNESCQPLEDCEAEAEAAASAVAVAAISNDETVAPAIGGCSASISVSKGLRGVTVDVMAAGMTGEQQPVTHSKGEDSCSVSLPADLSVETPPMSIWPPLPSPHSSSQVPSPFSGGPSSHFPFYDMNPMMGGPVFAFGPREESTGSQSQPQKSSAPTSGPLGTWQQCHPGVYSFYGPPAGFTAPFISPPGSVPEVQGPPHMVVYNHFAPVGQFGQVGLSYMGSTYIPSGKQPDWKHDLSSSGMGGGEGEMNSLNMVPVQRGAPNVPAQVQHVAPGSPLLSMASPLPMFEVSPLQSAPDASVHPRWSHVQASPIHSIPQSMQLQQQSEGAVPVQISRGGADHHPLTANGFSKPQTHSTLADGCSFGVGTNAVLTQMSDELGSVCQPASSGPESTTLNAGGKGHPGSTAGDSVRVDGEGYGCKTNSQVGASGSHKIQSAQQKNSSGRQQYGHYQRGGAQKNNSGVEWSNRKVGFHGRSHSSGGERGFPPAKVKQIYVAKQSTTGTSKAVEN